MNSDIQTHSDGGFLPHPRQRALTVAAERIAQA